MHTIEVEISDGIASATKTWNIDVEFVECKSSSSSGGVSPSKKNETCNELWNCTTWTTCERVDNLLFSKKITIDRYYDYLDRCAQQGLEKENCGYQTRACNDKNECLNTLFNIAKPEEFNLCHYTVNPTCFDGIKNCHDGLCEEGVDCGGPCEKQCAIETPESKIMNNAIIIALATILASITAFVITKLITIKKKNGRQR